MGVLSDWHEIQWERKRPETGQLRRALRCGGRRETGLLHGVTRLLQSKQHVWQGTKSQLPNFLSPLADISSLYRWKSKPFAELARRILDFCPPLLAKNSAFDGVLRT